MRLPLKSVASESCSPPDFISKGHNTESAPTSEASRADRERAAILGPLGGRQSRHTADDSLAPPVRTDPSTTPQPAHEQRCAGLPPAAALPLAPSPSSLSLPSVSAFRSGASTGADSAERGFNELPTEATQTNTYAACLLHRSAACSQPPAVESQMRFDGRAVGPDLPHFAPPRVPDPQGCCCCEGQCRRCRPASGAAAQKSTKEPGGPIALALCGCRSAASGGNRALRANARARRQQSRTGGLLPAVAGRVMTTALALAAGLVSALLASAAAAGLAAALKHAQHS